jgi:hypothetical protein
MLDKLGHRPSNERSSAIYSPRHPSPANSHRDSRPSSSLAKVLHGVADRLLPEPPPLDYVATNDSFTSIDSTREFTGLSEDESDANMESPRSLSALSGSAEDFEPPLTPEAASKAVDLPVTPVSSVTPVKPIPSAVKFDAAEMEKMFDRCLVGLELNLCHISPNDKTLLEAFQPDDWLALHQATLSAHPYAEAGEAAGAEAAGGIRYIEMEADLLKTVIRGLEKFPNLECLTVWAPKNGGTLDFGHLQGDKLRINVLGTPDLPSEIIACKGVPVAAGSGSNAALKASWVRRRDGDTVGKDSIPLGVSTPPAPAEDDLVTKLKQCAPLSPCLRDPKLRETLTSMVRTAAANSYFGPDPIDAATVADAILHCGTFDEIGAFGFDFRKLDESQARLVQALPVEAFAALQHYAARIIGDARTENGTDVHWVHLHDQFVINGSLITRLKAFAPLFRLFASVPLEPGESDMIEMIDFGELQAGKNRFTGLAELIIATPRPLDIAVARGVEVRAAEGTPQHAVEETQVGYVDEFNNPLVDEFGKPVEVGNMLPFEPASAATKV